MSRTKTVAARVTVDFARELETYAEEHGYLNLSDLFRAALREKIIKEASL